MAKPDYSQSSRRFALRVALRLLACGLLAAGLAACSVRAAAPPGALVYDGPQAYTLKPGDTLPGTDIRYIGATVQGAEFIIGEQRAVKHKADSLHWSGSPANGVTLDLRLRIAWYTQEALYAAGTGRLTVSNVAPQPGRPPAEAPLVYKAPVAHRIALSGMIPGTTISYEGQDGDGARFRGLEGYPQRKMGDSLVWEGQLQPGAMVRQELRLVQYDSESARFVGIAHIWITP